MGVYAKALDEIESKFSIIGKSLTAFGGKAGAHNSSLDFIHGGDTSFGAVEAYNQMMKNFHLGNPANYELVIKRVRNLEMRSGEDDFSYRVLFVLTASKPNDVE